MLAAKNNSKETLEYLLLRFPDYIYNTNKFGIIGYIIYHLQN